MLCISNMNEQYREYWKEHYGEDYDKEPSENSKMIMIQQYPLLYQRIRKIQKETSDKALFQENQKLKKELEDAMEKISHSKQDYSHIQELRKKDFSNIKMLKEKLEKQTINYSHISISHEKCMETLYGEKEKLKQELEYAMGEGEKLFQENKELKQELESLKQFELDRILDASMNEIFTTERQFLRESMIL